MIKFCAVLLLLIFSMIGCIDEKPESEILDNSQQESKQETPHEAISAIITLFESQQWESLIRNRYAELYKTESEEQVQSLIDRYDSMFSDDLKRQQAIDLYKSALNIDPVFSDENEVAQFNLESGFIKLSRMDSGLWGFHL